MASEQASERSNKEHRLTHLVGDYGYSAEVVAPKNWLIVGAEVIVRRSSPSGEWAGQVLRHAHAKWIEFEWHLRSGERRSDTAFVEPASTHCLGSQFNVKGPRASWVATVINSRWATEVEVEYLVPSSDVPRRRCLYGDHEFDYFAVEHPDGSATVKLPMPPRGSL